jgi:inosine-uridine nucleoside N-ribohydrolase
MERRSSGKYAGRKALAVCFLVLLAIDLFPRTANAQGDAHATRDTQKVIIDTDIGDDVDDAFALALALSSDHLQIIGVTTAWGDTSLRARLAQRLLNETGHGGITIAAGPQTGGSTAAFTQARWADQYPHPTKEWPDAVDFILSAIRKNPGEITLISLAPLSNVGALIAKDPAIFRQLKRVVMMGGSIRQGYGDLGYLPNRGPSAEYNIAMDIPAAKQLFASGVPIVMMPLDSTQLKLDEVLRGVLFRQNTAATNALEGLYHQWSGYPDNVTPTLFDAMAVGVVIDPKLCPMTKMRLRIDDEGFTRVENGPPNANVCLHSDSDQFFHFYLPQILNRK